jgi:integrase
MTQAMPKTKRKKKRKYSRDRLYLRRGIFHFRIKLNGVWVARSAHTPDREEAKKARLRALTEAEEGQLPTDFANLAFNTAADKWIESRKGERDPVTRQPRVQLATWRVDKYRLEKLKDFFADKKLIHISARDVAAYQTTRLEKVTATTINSEVKLLRLMLRKAGSWKRIANDFKPLPEAPSQVGQPFTEKEEEKLVTLALNDPGVSVAALAALVCINTGLRGGELKKLRLGDVDLIEKALVVRRAITKTNAGKRVIPLNELAEWALAKLVERATALRATESEHYLFPFCIARRTKDEKTYVGYDVTRHQTSFRTGWRLLLKRAGLTHTRFHNTRHSFVSKLGEKGIADHVIMGLAGHSARKMLDHYSKARLEAKRNAVAALNPIQEKSEDARQAVDTKNGAATAAEEAARVN